MSPKTESEEKPLDTREEATPATQRLQEVKENLVVSEPSINNEMETHAHHLHKAPGKGIWHYLFEFLMLFLAVTLGFFVENQRERFIEHKREIEYARSLYNDLKIDTAVIQRTINEKAWIAPKFDSALRILDRHAVKENNEFMYYISRYLTFNDAFTSQDATYKQLSSGNFRYISDTRLYTQIAGYYNLYSRYQMYDIYGEVKDDNWAALETRLFDPKDFYSLTVGGGGTFYDLQRPKGKFRPMYEDEQSLRQLYRKFAIAKQSAVSTQIMLNWLKTEAVKIIKELEKEYPG